MPNNGRIPILPRNHLYVDAFKHKEDGVRIAALFLDTWRSLPLGVRRRLLKYWRENRSSYFRPDQPAPTIELSDLLPTLGGDLGGSLGVWYPGQLALRLAWPTVAIMPDEHVKTVIAHELAHASIQAEGAEGFEEEAEEDAEEEEWAREACQSWGFDEYALDQWVIEHREELKALAPRMWAKLDTCDVASTGQGEGDDLPF